MLRYRWPLAAGGARGHLLVIHVSYYDRHHITQFSHKEQRGGLTPQREVDLPLGRLKVGSVDCFGGAHCDGGYCDSHYPAVNLEPLIPTTFQP